MIGGFTDHPYGEDQMRCLECMYYLVHRKWCDLPELAVPVEPDWWCRLWRNLADRTLGASEPCANLPTVPRRLRRPCDRRLGACGGRTGGQVFHVKHPLKHR